MTVDEVMNRVQSGQSARDAKNAKLGTNSGDAAKGNNTEFQAIANSDFEERRQREIEIMKDIVYGKTPMNILKTTSERNDATEITFKTIDGKVDESKKVAPQRMTAESFIKTIMTIRNLSGQNVMIPESEIKKMGLELAPYAKPFYDEKNNKFYELSVTRCPGGYGVKRIKLYKNNKVSQSTIDKLNAPSVKPKDGFAPDVEAALSICNKLSAITTGIKLEPSEKANTFMPSTLGKISKKAKGALSAISLNRWQSKKFIPQSGKLFVNIDGMNGTDILTNYLSSCAMRSFDTNLSTFLNVVNSDRGFQSLDAKAKNVQLEDYKKNYELIKYKLHNICTDLIASEMCKMLPDMAAEERLALSEGYLTSAMQRMNELGKYLQDPYVMKFISKTVTDSVSRYNANYTFSTKQIVDANCKVCGYRNMFTVGNRDKAIFGEYEVPTNGDFKFSSFPTREVTKEKSELDNANETATPTADRSAIIDKLAQADKAAKALAGVVVKTTNEKSINVTQENTPTSDSESVGMGEQPINKNGDDVFNLKHEDAPLIFDSQGRVVNNEGKTHIFDPKWGYNTESVNLVELAESLNKNNENDIWGYNTESVNLVELAESLNKNNAEERETDDEKKGKVKKNDEKVKPVTSGVNGGSTEYGGSLNKTFDEKTSESRQKSITKYVVGLTANALREKSLKNKKSAVEKENLDTLASKKVQAISSSQNAVTTLYNSVHNVTTAKQAKDVIDKAERSSENAQVIEAATLKELDDIATKEVAKVLKVYEENKDKYPEWGKCKTPASFMNYYHKNIVGAKTKYGNDFKKQVGLTCRKMDAAVVADTVLASQGVNYRMYDATTFIVRDEKNDAAGLNAYTVHKIVEKQDAEPKIEKLTVYSGNASLAENAEFDEQFRETFATVDNMQANGGYIGKGIKGIDKPVVYSRRVADLRRAKMRDNQKNGE